MLNFFAKRKTQPSKPRSLLSFFKLPIAGEKVDDITAFNFSSFWACQRIISETIASVPWHVFGQESKQKANREHPLDPVIYRQPNSEMSAFSYKELIFQHGTGWGNHYSEIERSGTGDVVNLWPLDPDSVNIDRDSNGRIFYDIDQQGGANKSLKAEDIYHVRGPSRDGLKGYSVIDLAKESISLGLAAEAFGGAFFGNGAMPATVIKGADGIVLDEGGVKNLLASWRKKHGGSRNTQKVEYLEHGFDVKQLSIAPENAQFLQTRKFQNTDMARWFRIPPHKVADLERSTHNNIESQNIEFVTDAIVPWVSRGESEANFRLLKRGDKHYTKFNIMGLLRGDSAARREWYKTMSFLGAFTIDDILGFEDMDPIGGDVGSLRMVPVNMTTPEMLIKGGPANMKFNVNALVQEQAERFCCIELKRIESIFSKSAGNLESGLRNFYIEHAKTLSDKFMNLAIAVCNYNGVDIEGIEERVMHFFGTYCANSADEAHMAAQQNKKQDLLVRWQLNKAPDLTNRFVHYLLGK